METRSEVTQVDAKSDQPSPVEANVNGEAKNVLHRIEAHAEGRLVLPEQEGERAALAEINLSRSALQARRKQAEEPVPWWDDEQDTVCLRNADLRGANLRKANLEGVDLSGADLRGADLGGVNLRNALLKNANLNDADLASANLEEAEFGKANLEEALLENANLRGARLRFAKLGRAAMDNANLVDTDLWGADLQGAFLVQVNLRGSQLHEVNLTGADLSEADLSDSNLRAANLEEASLDGVDLRKVKLQGANLNRADLKRTQLQDVRLTHCDVRHVHLSGARLDKTRLEQKQLGGAIGEERTGDYEAAGYGYLALEQNFEGLGDPDAASWAYIRKREMQKYDAKQRAREAWSHDRRASISHYSDYVQAKLVEWVCNYGESIPRTLGAIAIVYLIFTLAYGLTGSVVRVLDSGGMETLHLWPPGDLLDVATFGLITMTTPEGPQVALHPANDAAHILTSLQTLLTIGLTGLLGFVLGNRIRR